MKASDLFVRCLEAEGVEVGVLLRRQSHIYRSPERSVGLTHRNIDPPLLMIKHLTCNSTLNILS